MIALVSLAELGETTDGSIFSPLLCFLLSSEGQCQAPADRGARSGSSRSQSTPLSKAVLHSGTTPKCDWRY